MAKFLVIRFSSIGDIVLCTPVFRHLKKQVLGGAEVHFLTKKNFAFLLEDNPYIDKTYSIEHSTHEVREDIKNEDYDFIIDLHNNVRSRMIKRKTKVLDFTINKRNWEKWHWVNFGKNHLPDEHIVDRYMQCISSFDIKNDGEGLDYFIPENQRVKCEGKFISWAIGAAHPGKVMGKEKLSAILALIDMPIKLIGGPEDEILGKEIESKFHHVESLAGQLNIHESASVIEQSDLLITPDTGMMHIAAALQKKTLSYWGCTHPGLGMYPYMDSSKYRIVMPEGGRSKPCSKLGNRCKYDQKNPCPNQIDNREFLNALDDLI
ncbi:MAG: glycosyltransferase family 9 protein [Bacteroidota bacterium]